MYRDAGIDLVAEATVGVGSVCRREATHEAAEIIAAIVQAVPGIRLHGFGVKTSGLGKYGSLLHSCDSLAWSMAARKQPALPGCAGHKTCANCSRLAFRWRERVLASLAAHATRAPQQTGNRVCRKLDTATAEARLALGSVTSARPCTARPRSTARTPRTGSASAPSHP
jgi:hypothetical protein